MISSVFFGFGFLMTFASFIFADTEKSKKLKREASAVSLGVAVLCFIVSSLYKGVGL